MRNFIRYWNQNRKQIIIMVAVIAFIIIIIHVLNDFLKSNRTNNISNATIADSTKPTQSVISETTVSEQKTDENTDIIKQFVDYGNNKNYEQAYSLLTQSCKEEFNNDLDTFISNYCKAIFDSAKTYNLDLWLVMNNVYTYKITYFNNNLLETGNLNGNKNIEDYVSVIKENNENKVSINGFIDKKEINKSAKVQDIEIIVNSKKIYKNYETYNITIKNNTSKTISISGQRDDNDICLIDKNDVEYPSFSSEISFSNLPLKAGYEKNIDIKFNKIYDLYRTIEKLQFKNIVLDIDNAENQSAESNKVSIVIDL